jgi:hypothetical protein
MATKAEIQKRLKDAMLGITPDAPSMVPAYKDKKEEEPRPDIKEIGLPASVRIMVRVKVLRSNELAALIKKLKTERDEISKDIKRRLDSCDIEETRFECEGIPVTRYKSQRKSIKRELLIERGVKATIVDDCTKISNVDNLRIGGGEDDE